VRPRSLSCRNGAGLVPADMHRRRNVAITLRVMKATPVAKFPFESTQPGVEIHSTTAIPHAEREGYMISAPSI
jgi:hypothetical protein